MPTQTTINGIVQGIQSGDAITIIEIVWKLRTSTGPDVYESEATAQANGRGIILTTYANRTALSAAMTAAGNTLSSGMTDSIIVYGSTGGSAITSFWNYTTPSVAGIGYTLSTSTLISGTTYTPAIRVSESRNSGTDMGPYTGVWTSQAPLVVTNGSVIYFQDTFDASLSSLTWNLPPFQEGSVGTGSSLSVSSGKLMGHLISSDAGYMFLWLSSVMTKPIVAGMYVSWDLSVMQTTAGKTYWAILQIQDSNYDIGTYNSLFELQATVDNGALTKNLYQYDSGGNATPLGVQVSVSNVAATWKIVFVTTTSVQIYIANVAIGNVIDISGIGFGTDGVRVGFRMGTTDTTPANIYADNFTFGTTG